MEAPIDRAAQRGLALVSVLSGVAVLALIAAAVLSSGRLAYHLGWNYRVRAVAEASAEAAINRAILGLLDDRLDQRWRVDGVSRQLSYGGQSVTVTVQDVLGLIDINATDDATLHRLFLSAGMADTKATALVDKVLDWREPGDAHRLNGAKAAAYRAAGLAYTPRGGSFQGVDELRLVKDMPPDVFSRIEPALTVHSGRPLFDPATAPLEALQALPDMDAAKAKQIVSDRTLAGVGQVPSGVIDTGTPMAGRAFAISVELDHSGGHLRRQTVIRITADPTRPILILDWR